MPTGLEKFVIHAATWRWDCKKANKCCVIQYRSGVNIVVGMLKRFLKQVRDLVEDVKEPVRIDEDNQSCIKLLKQGGETVYCSSSDMLAN